MLANINGAQYLFKDKLQNGETLIFTDIVPVSGLPLELEYNKFKNVYEKTVLWHQLMISMANDSEWIEKIYKNMNDEFLQKHVQIWKKVLQSNTANKANFTITRNDMMFDAIKQKWQQIEFNTVAVGFGHLCDQVLNYHQSIKNSYYKKILNDYQQIDYKNDNLAPNALEEAFKLYGNSEAIIIMVTSEYEGNQYDQRFIENILASRGIIMLRKTFQQLEDELVSDLNNAKIFVKGLEIAVVYYRCGYSPDHYQSEKSWQVREQLEMSQAYKCPNISVNLINFKRAQQQLQCNNTMQRFFKNQQDIDSICENFALIYDFEDEKNQENLIQLTKENPTGYVLKPQREGGSNNFYGNDIYILLQKLNVAERKNYILMEKVKSQPNFGVLIKRNTLEAASVISEIGFFGYFLCDKENKKILKNEKGGYLVRTKKFQENEGGVAAGYSVINSIIYK